MIAARIVVLFVVVLFVVVSAAVGSVAGAKDTCFGKILKVCKANKTISAEVNALLTNKQFDQLLALTFTKIEEMCDKTEYESIRRDFEQKAETVEMTKELLGLLTVKERLHVKSMVVEENRIGVYGFFVTKAMNFLTNPKVASLVWRIAHRLPQLSIPRTSI